MSINENNNTCEVGLSQETHNQLRIAYMMNPDVVVYSTMDEELISHLKNQGAEVIPVKLEDINFNINNEHDSSYSLFINDKPLKIDGFLAYGYMSPFHYEAYKLINFSLNEMGITTLYCPNEEEILNNKYLQTVKFKKEKVNIPSTNIGFSVTSFKDIMKNFYNNESVMKNLSDYGGDGVKIHKNINNAVNAAAKSLWNNELCLFQTTIKDSPGKSVRVMLINNKPVACVEYSDKTGNFISNFNHGLDFCALNNLMNSPKLQQYYNVGIDAVTAIGKNITIAGVDLLDSKEHGLVVLEVNAWPDMYDPTSCTEIDIFSLFAKAFYNKVLASSKEEKKWDHKIRKISN
jgi:ribosomal protein S6--L-glutamate ligase